MDGEYGSFQFLNTKVTAEKKSASRIPMKLTKKTMNYTHNLTLTCEWLLNQIPKRNAISILFYSTTPRPTPISLRKHLIRQFLKDPKRDQNLLAWEGSKIKTMEHGTLPLAWPGVLEPEQKGTTPAWPWAQVASCTAALVHWRSTEAVPAVLHHWL